MRLNALLLLMFIGFGVRAQIITTSAGSFTSSTSLNGMITVAASSPKYQPAEIQIVVRTGSVYERVYQSGISTVVGEIVSDRINKALATGSYPNFRFSYIQSYEHSTFKFKAPNAEFSSLLNFIAKEFTGIKIVDEDLQKFIPVVNEKRAFDSIDSKNQFRFVVHHRLFKRDYDKMLLYGEAADLAKLSTLEVDSFYRMNYVPNNATVIVFSSLGVNQQLLMVEQALINWRKTDFNPDELTKIRTFKPMIYSTQDVVVNENEPGKLTYASLASGTRSYLRGTYYNFLLSAMLNDTTQGFYKAMHEEEINPKKVSAQFDAGSFYGIFKIIIHPKEEEYAATHSRALQVFSKLHEYINEESVAKAKLKFGEEYKALLETQDYVPLSVKFYFTNSEKYFETLNDSVQNLHTKDFLKFIYTTYSIGAFANILEIDSAHLESERVADWFESVDEGIENESFTYRKNIADLEGEENARLLRKLVQWLKVNPDIQCQINGRSDKKEFNKFSNADVFEFIDTIPTFRKYKPDTYKKKTIRLELLRSYKLLKLLVENEIELNRLAGTAMTYGSKTDEQYTNNRRCTLTLNRLRKRLPLRDINIFGK